MIKNLQEKNLQKMRMNNIMIKNLEINTKILRNQLKIKEKRGMELWEK
jgi:hypothetical protein